LERPAERIFMSRLRFITRVVAIVCGIAVFQVSTMEFLVYQSVNPTLKDTVYMLTYPGPVVLVFLFVFLVLVYFYLRPVLRFLDKQARGEQQDDEFIRSLQDRSIFFPYFMAILAYPFYMVGGSLASWIVCRNLGWPMEMVAYGFLGGLISSFLSTPISIYGFSWVMRPVINLSCKAAKSIEPARSAGLKISVGMKLVITVLSLVLAITGYTVVVGYRRTQFLFQNMQKMEKLLPDSTRAQLANDVERTFDNRAKSASYFNSQLGNLLIFYITLMGLGVVISLILSIAAALEITSPIRVLKGAALQVRAGNYGEPIRLISNDELAGLGSAFNQMMVTIAGHIHSMERLVEKLKDGIHHIDETVNTIASVSGQQSGGAADQAMSLQQTSSIAKEIAYTAKQIEKRANMMNEFASATFNSSQDGKEKLERSQEEFVAISDQMDAISTAMGELEVRFREAYNIVALIKDMAEKTEILSLNASIEAASAGLEGKRFMVVAEETRNLSARSAEAVRQIKELVATIQKATVESMGVTEAGKAKVVAGGKTIESALVSLKTISSFAESTLAAVNEITVSTAEQTKASEQLAGSVSEIYNVSKNVEKGAKEIDSAITSLKGVAESLRKTIQEKDKV